MMIGQEEDGPKGRMNKRISIEDRKKIEELLHAGMKHRQICKEIGIYPTTLYREFKRCSGVYSAEEAQKTYCQSANLIDWEIIGKRFGLLIVESYANKYNKRTWWNCKCDCGKLCVISRKKLTEYCSPDRPMSCGCVAKEHLGNGLKVPIEEAMLRKYQDLLTFRKINGACWNWTGFLQKGKVPKTSWKNKAMTVRKCMYLVSNGILFEPNRVYTTCGNLKCFNPEHLTLEVPTKRHYYD